MNPIETKSYAIRARTTEVDATTIPGRPIPGWEWTDDEPTLRDAWSDPEPTLPPTEWLR